MPEFDRQKYADLLAQVAPTVIDSPEEHERQLTKAEELMDRGAAMLPEERKLLELLVLLIEVFEREVEEAEAGVEDEPGPPEEDGVAPHEILHRLLRARGWEPERLNDVFGNPKIVARILSGGQKITKGQAKALGLLFQVADRLFISE